MDIVDRLRSPTKFEVEDVQGMCLEAADEIERLRLEAQTTYDTLTEVVLKETNRAERAEAALATARRDAERYRWLRDVYSWESAIPRFEWDDAAHTLDAAIDRALAEKERK